MTTTDPNAPLARFCLTLEEFRRSPDGRVRAEREFVSHFFAYDANEATDIVFRHLPREVRGPILSAWKIRGQKTAVRDDDAKVKEAVHDALVSGDIDALTFETGIAADVLIRWVPLSDWWSFWRGGNLSERAILKALSTGYELGLFDAHWFLTTLEAGAESKGGIEVLSEGLSKADLTEWLRTVHQGGDGSPKGLVLALGWEKIVHHTKPPILIAVLDALASKTGLTKSSATAAPEAGAADPLDAVFMN
ncbi:hypothetical protein [Pendulispora albinea]|uniref:Uncharacterized protein n=1 Tax=Pendulispora albinea TaxID=2741071 RepID=A0ABZ2LY26_9BACT